MRASPILVAAAVLLDEEGRVLLTRRPEGTHLAGLWELPGGKVEAGEDPEDAVVRECLEELAIRVEVRDIYEVRYHAYQSEEESKEVLLLFYLCRHVSGEIEHLGVAEHAWVPPEELDRYPLPPPDARLVRKLKQRAAQDAPSLP